MNTQKRRYLVVGLGNPGSRYQHTRHNVGFVVIDKLIRRFAIPSISKKFRSEFAEIALDLTTVFLIKPQTYMNQSGVAVGEVVSYYKISPECVIVINDDLDLPPGTLRVRENGGSGGHNGLKSVIDALGTENFPRIRIGIGRSILLPSESYVLVKMNDKEIDAYNETTSRAAEAVEAILKSGTQKAMNLFNVNPKGESSAQSEKNVKNNRHEKSANKIKDEKGNGS